MSLPTVESVTEAAVELAHRWAVATEEGQTRAERRSAGQLAALVADPAGLDLAMRFVDRVARPEDLKVAARELGNISAAAASSFLSPADRALLKLGALAAPLAPPLVVPAARARLRQLVGHLVVDAEDPALSKHLAAAKEQNYRLNINLLGEMVLGEDEAARRTERTRQILAREDVDYVSIKVSSLVSQISTWDTAGTTARVLERLRPLYRTAAAGSPPSFVNLDMEEYRDLDLTLDVFEALLSEPEFTGLEAGVVLQAYLPDSMPALERLIDFARRRRAAGGAAIKVRLVKGANLAMERVDAEVHNWPQAPYLTKAEVDANYVRMLDRTLRPEVSDGLRVGVASHNLFHVALAHHLARARQVSHALDVEMLQGMAPAQARAVSADVSGELILYTPVVAPTDFDVAVSYLVRRLEENAAPENFLHALFAESRGQWQTPMVEQEERFRASVTDREEAFAGSRRQPDRPEIGASFANTPDSDPALPQSRLWAEQVLSASPRARTSPQLADTAAVDQVVGTARSAGDTWAQVPAEDRGAVLRTAARELESRRGQLLTQMAHEGGKTIAEGDPEVSEAIDFARYYADRAEELPQIAAAEGLTFTPSTAVLVTPPWNFPVAIPIGGVLAALAAGAGVIIKPAPQTPGCVEIPVAAVRDALHHHGYDPDTVQVVRTGEDEVGRHLVAHPGFDQVILTGAYQTAQMFGSWRHRHSPAGPGVVAETSGKNALIVTPSADYDLAVADVLRSAFGHAGQKCSACSLLILVGSAGTSARFRRQLIDAVASLRVGWPQDLSAMMGPVIDAPSGKLARVQTQLEPGEHWLVEPRALDDTGRLWSPGLKEGVAPGSPFHLTEYFGPVLGIMRADTLEQAIAWQNATDYGLTGGLHSLERTEIDLWLRTAEVGNAYVNRGITGAIVQRQSFGGWKRSTVGPGAKAGGPNYVAQFGTWEQAGVPAGAGAPGRRVSALLQEVTLPQQEMAWLGQAAGSDAYARDVYFRAERDLTGLAAEANI
ncbi:MAG TPA: bifunctional proline dehydrogenase/L-glutamate gamma-semialdehyde dehydrogenase, partial [Beutenbergiaceae bacterium]|nr:bifunctional proline dehydrogenase/L-glutamate gamma-semialdehyde dehydrogenase [Beutenbergiaceae bacterium]